MEKLNGFWIRLESRYFDQIIIEDDAPIVQKMSTKGMIHVRTVSPSYDEAFNEMLTSLEEIYELVSSPEYGIKVPDTQYARVVNAAAVISKAEKMKL
jgi:hypothetical protein